MVITTPNNMNLLAQLPYRLMTGHLFTLLLCQSATAQAPETPEAVKNMMALVGRWEATDVKLTIGDQHYTTPYLINCTAINDGTGLMMQEGANIPGLAELKGMNLVGWDPNLQQMHVYSVDNLGTCHDHVGYWNCANELYVQYQGVIEGKMYVEQIWIRLEEGGRMHLILLGELNGAAYEHIEGTFHRKAG